MESGFVIELGRARERLRGGDGRVGVESRLQRSIGLAELLRARLAAGGVNQAALAREHGITRARVTQLLALLRLPTEVLAWIGREGQHEQRLSERWLRPLLSAPRREQLRAVASAYSSFRHSPRARAS